MPGEFPVDRFEELAIDMLREAESAEAVYRPGPYWKPHVQAMLEAVRRCGLDAFRSSPDKAINALSGDYIGPNTALRPRLWKLHGAIGKLPVLSKVSRAYQAEIDGPYDRLKSARALELRLAEWLLQDWEEFTALEDHGVGTPLMFDIRGKQYSQKFLRKALDLLDLKQNWNGSFGSVLEIGAGFGQLAELAARTYPITKYVILDLAPNCLFSEYFLTQNFPGEVAGWRHLRDETAIHIDNVDAKFIVLPVHKLPQLEGQFDLFVNQASFQEMTVDIVTNYASHIKSMCKSVYSSNRRVEEKPTSPGVDTEFYLTVFSPLQCKQRWPHPLHPGYDNLLLER